MAEPLLLMIVSGILTTLLGVGFGCLILELTVRAMRHKLTEQPIKAGSEQFRFSLPLRSFSRK